jgi:hypothetical protein
MKAEGKAQGWVPGSIGCDSKTKKAFKVKGRRKARKDTKQEMRRVLSDAR